VNKHIDVLTMSTLLEERIHFLNELFGSNGTKVFRHSSSSFHCRHTVVNRLTLDVIPYVLIMLQTGDAKNKPSTNREKISSVSCSPDANETTLEGGCNDEGELEFDITSDGPRRSSRTRVSRYSAPLVDTFLTRKQREFTDIWSTVANALLCPVEMLHILARVHTIK